MAAPPWKPSTTLDRDLHKDPKYLAGLESVAQRVADAVRNGAPAGGDDGNREHFKDSIHVVRQPRKGGGTQIGVAGNALTHLIEGGTVDRHNSGGANRGRMPAQHLFAKACRQLGLARKHG